MLKLEELRKEIKGEIFVQEDMAKHDIKKVTGVADILVKPSGKKDLAKVLQLLRKSRFPYVVINRKGRVLFPEDRYHGVVIVMD
ncbi:MAG: hypothetical protein MI702_12280 [Chlorobiales bacterium]|nr:hypothetical protein [Chlorobiales bacterium]